MNSPCNERLNNGRKTKTAEEIEKEGKKRVNEKFNASLVVVKAQSAFSTISKSGKLAGLNQNK